MGQCDVRAVRPGRSRAKSDFLTLPARIYSANTAWVPPLFRDTCLKLDPVRNPFYTHGEVQPFVAYANDGQACGRVAAITNRAHEQAHGDNAGFFGLFECVHDPGVAHALFEHVIEFLRARGCQAIIGPVNLSTNDESGLLLDGYDRAPTFMCNYCLPYYHDLLVGCGFRKAIDTLSFESEHGHPFPEKYRDVLRRAEQNPRLSARKFDRRNPTRDILQISDIYNDAFRGTWGFVPITSEEARVLGKQLLQFADLDLVWIADYDGEAVGMILGFPDLNESLKSIHGRLFPFGLIKLLWGMRHIQGMRVAAFAVKPQFRLRGIETLLIRKVHERINDRPYRRAEFSVVMEDNKPMRRLLEALGFELKRRFRIYQADIGIRD